MVSDHKSGGYRIEADGEDKESDRGQGREVGVKPLIVDTSVWIGRQVTYA